MFFGISKKEHDPQPLEPVEEQLEALEQVEYLKMSSYSEVARWLTDYTGRYPLMGLWKRVETDESDRREYVKQTPCRRGRVPTTSTKTKSRGLKKNPPREAISADEAACSEEAKSAKAEQKKKMTLRW